MSTEQIVSVVAALAALALSLYVLVFARRQRVTLEPPPTAEPAQRRTFERSAAPPAPAAEAIAPSAFLPAAPDAALTLVKGLGPKAAAQLAGLGIASLDALAALAPAEAEAIDARMGGFKGRMARDRWIEQARLLAAGDRAAFEARFGKLGATAPPSA